MISALFAQTFLVPHPQAFQWNCPHWGWFFCGFAAGAFVISLTHRVRGG
jgi:hypothetical protein